MKLRTSRAGLFAIAITAAAGLAALGASGAALAQKSGGTLVIGPEAEFNGFNVAISRTLNTNSLLPAREVMEALFSIDENGQPEPELALSFDMAPDLRSAIIKLRQGVKFHDGTPFNADVVVWHYNRILNLKNGTSITSIEHLDSIEKVDEYTVKANFKLPWAAAHSSMASPGITALIGSPTALEKDPEGFHRKPIGTGPFILKEWRSGDRVILEKNPNYWQAGLPYLDQVVYRIMPDGNTRYQSLRAGEVDIAWLSMPQQVVEAKKDAGLVVYAQGAGTSHAYNFNNEKPPFDDARVRAAMIHAFNAPVLAKSYYLDTATATKAVFPEDSPWFCPNLDWRGYDLEKAKSLVKEVGKPISFTITTISTPEWRRMSGIIQQMAKEAGMDAKIELVDQTENLRRGLTGDFQMNIWRVNPNGAEPSTTLSFSFGSSRGTKSASRNDPTKIDAILQASQAEPNLAKRIQMYCDVNQLISNDAVMLMGHHTPLYSVAKPYVKGVRKDSLNGIRTARIWLDK